MAGNLVLHNDQLGESKCDFETIVMRFPINIFTSIVEVSEKLRGWRLDCWYSNLLFYDEDL